VVDEAVIAGKILTSRVSPEKMWYAVLKGTKKGEAPTPISRQSGWRKTRMSVVLERAGELIIPWGRDRGFERQGGGKFHSHLNETPDKIWT